MPREETEGGGVARQKGGQVGSLFRAKGRRGSRMRKTPQERVGKKGSSLKIIGGRGKGSEKQILGESSNKEGAGDKIYPKKKKTNKG